MFKIQLKFMRVRSQDWMINKCLDAKMLFKIVIIDIIKNSFYNYYTK